MKTHGRVYMDECVRAYKNAGSPTARVFAFRELRKQATAHALSALCSSDMCIHITGLSRKFRSANVPPSFIFSQISENFSDYDIMSLHVSFANELIDCDLSCVSGILCAQNAMRRIVLLALFVSYLEAPKIYMGMLENVAEYAHAYACVLPTPGMINTLYE